MPNIATPTHITYNSLELAYQHFNRELFASELPPCLITLQRKGKRIRAYFSAYKFENNSGTKTDEIALNPMHFRARSDKDTLSTLAHEMTHLWQQHFGKPSRHGYHNKEWAAKMKTIGLHPSNTGAPGGKETGESMTHYVVPHSQFHKAVEKLINRGFKIEWGDAKTAEQTGASLTNSDDDKSRKKTKDKSNRVKYTCGKCQANAWGKCELKLVCGACMETMRATSEKEPEAGL